MLSMNILYFWYNSTMMETEQTPSFGQEQPIDLDLRDSSSLMSMESKWKTKPKCTSRTSYDHNIMIQDRSKVIEGKIN